ncbi:MAG TPA: APC family permease [Gemmatimonadaceae bacterium]|nr:APC family permease [Gemmatimonadaceae bacterium]
MSGERSEATPVLRRTMSLRDLVLFNLVAVLSLRWLNTSAKSGPSSLVLWLLAAVLFFVPQGLAVAELSARYPKEGGIYFWTRRRFGEGHGFFCGWCYWVVNILYYPNLLTAAAVIALYVVGKGDSGLASSWYYVMPACTLMLWFATALNIVGLGTGKWLQNVGGIGAFLAGAILLVVGIHAVFTHPSANPITLHSIVPNFGSLSEVNLWASIAFAFSGLELAASLGDEIHEPARALPRAIYLSAPVIAGLYILGTVCVLWIVPLNSISITSGFLQAIESAAGHYWWLAPLAAGVFTIGNIGGAGAWLAGPARVAFVIGLDKYFPPAFGRIHPRWGTPYVAILVQAIAATIVLPLVTLGKGSSVEQVYQIVLDMNVLIYFIPFIYLFCCLLFEGDTPGPTVIPGGRIGRYIAGSAGLFVTIFAIIVAAIPPSDQSPLWFEVKVLGGVGLFYFVGWLFYRRGTHS